MSEAFQEARRAIWQTNPSAQERDLIGLLERHGVEEGELLARYQRFATDADSETVRYLVKLIVDDEQRHHRVLEQIANSVAWGGFDPGHPVEQVPEERIAATADLRSETEALLDQEEADGRELRRLRRVLKPFADTTLWSLLVDTMLLDTEKHVRILKFIRDHAASS